MIRVSILEDHDILLPTDWCRPLQLVSMSGGQSDEYSFENCYTGQPENNVKWVPAGEIFGDLWFGKTLKELNKMLQEYHNYEFVRGNIPKSHQYGLTRRQRKELLNKKMDSIISFGKHTGKTFNEVKQQDRSYFNWLEGEHLLPSLGDE